LIDASCTFTNPIRGAAWMWMQQADGQLINWLSVACKLGCN
jgi:hypothetical protein